MSLIRLNRNPSRAQLRVFAIAWLLFIGAIGLKVRSIGGPSAPSIWFGAAVGLPLIGILFPGALRVVYLGLSYATYPIGYVISHLILTLIYWTVFTPIGLVMRLAGYDPLTRRREKSSASYWQLRTEAKPPESYLRQR